MTQIANKVAIESVADLKKFKIWALAALPSAKAPNGKNPLMLDGTDAKTNDPNTWSSFSDVWKVYQPNKSGYKGIGFMFCSEIGLGGVDLDGCVDAQGNISEYAHHVVSTLNSYTEYSCSGTGLHILTRGNLPRSIGADPLSYARIEMYKNDKGRFLVTTGKRLPGTPETINERQEELLTIHAEALAIRQQEREARKSAARTTTSQKAKPLETAQGNTPYGQKALQEEADELASMPEGGRNVRLNQAAFKLGQLIAGGQLEEFTVVRELTAAALACGLDEREIEKTLSGGLEAGKREPRKPDLPTEAKKTGVYIPPAPPAPDEPFNLTDLGNAERFALRYKDTVRWCGTWNAWMIFNGKCWEQDKIGRVGQLAKIIVRSIYAEAAKMEDEKMRPKLAKHAAASESNRSVRAMLDLAKSELPAIPDDFNKHLYLVNFENGTYDVQTGELRPHSPHDMLTRVIKYKYNPLSTSERWKGFMSTIFGGDTDLISFMQQALGMSLCGDTSEQCLFICHGMGSNGKTTMLEIIRIIMASYACAANIETFQMRKTETIGNDVAELYGARMVTASETKLGGRLNEAFVKKATGKEPLRARRLHENEFEFMPEFTLWLAVNHKPVVLDTSKGMWRRVRFIPFNVTFEEKDIDPQFGNKLLEEAEGILAWLVQGCREWIIQGRLSVPQVVKEATEGYRAEMDIVANFLRDECILEPGKKAQTQKLIARFESWCTHNSEKFDAKILKNSLKERGLQSQKGTGGVYFWQNIGLIDNEGPTEDPLWEEEDKKNSGGTEKDLSLDSGGSGGSGPKNKVNQELKNPPDATLNSRPLRPLPPLSSTFSNEEEQEQVLLNLFNEVRILLDTSANVRTDKQGTKIEYWPKKEAGGYPGGFIPVEQFQVQLLEMVTSQDQHKVQQVEQLLQTLKRQLNRNVYFVKEQTQSSIKGQVVK